MLAAIGPIFGGWDVTAVMNGGTKGRGGWWVGVTSLAEFKMVASVHQTPCTIKSTDKIPCVN